MAKQDQIPGLHCPLPLSNLNHKGFWFRTTLPTNSPRSAHWVWTSENAAHRNPNVLGWNSRFNPTIFLYEFYELYHKQITLRNNSDKTTGQPIKCHHVLEGPLDKFTKNWEAKSSIKDLAIGHMFNFGSSIQQYSDGTHVLTVCCGPNGTSTSQIQWKTRRFKTWNSILDWRMI